MKKIYTQKDFESFEIIDGIKQCPSGDYSQISSFAERCSFAEGCSFAEWCSFAERCSFAEGCSFAKRCSFAEGCSFAERCSFAKRCSFAEGCSFAEWCSFENKNRPKNYKSPFFAIDRIGSESRKAYFFNFEDGIHVRAGCFFGNEKQFIEKLESDEDNAKTKIYKAALSLAKMYFGIEESPKFIHGEYVNERKIGVTNE